MANNNFTCETCKFWNTDRPEFLQPDKEGWGYCTNRRIETQSWMLVHSTNNKSNPQKDSIVSTEHSTFLTKELDADGVRGIFETGKNFGCVHHVSK